MEVETTSQLLNQYLELKEVQLLEKFFNNIDIDTSSLDIKEIYIKYMALTGSIEIALVLIDKWDLKNNNLKVESLFLAGHLSSAIEEIDENIENYLKAEIYIASENYELAKNSLKHEALDKKWYYFMGRIYSHKNELTKALECLKSALKHSDDKKFQALIISNQVVLYSRMHLNREAIEASNKLSRLVLNNEIHAFPEFRAKLLINNGLFLGNLGLSREALKHIIRAKIILEKSINAHDYIRVNLTYAYNIAENGYIDKAISTLNQLNPKKVFQKFDKYRYLMRFYAKFSDKVNFEKSSQLAEKYKDENDSFDIIHYEIDKYIAQIYNNEDLQNQQKITHLAQKYDDIESYYYFLSNSNFLNLNYDRLDESLNYHLENSLYKELSQDRVMKSLYFFTQKKYRKSLDELSRINESSNKYVLGLVSIIKHQAQSMLSPEVTSWKGANKSLFKDLNFIFKYLSKESGLHEHYAKLTEYQVNYILKLSQILELGLEKAVNVLSDKSETVLTDFEKNEIASHQDKCLLDFDKNQFFILGTENNKILKSETQYKLLKYLAINRKVFSTKEDIILNVFQKKIYDPVTDNNLLYVNINRLKKNLGHKDLIIVKDGEYKLNNDNTYIIL